MNTPPDERRIRVALVDDHEIVAVALQSSVEPMDDVEFVGAAGTVNELLDRYGTPDLVVLDLRLADGSSPATNIRRLREKDINVLAFTSGENPFLVRVAAQSDVLGVVRKSEPIDVLQAAIRAAARGEHIISSDWAAALDADPDLRNAGLSEQEGRVLALFASGEKAQTVAFRMGLSVTTVEDYVRRIRSKYARAQRPARTKIDLYKRALEDGFLPLPDTPRAKLAAGDAAAEAGATA